MPILVALWFHQQLQAKRRGVNHEKTTAIVTLLVFFLHFFSADICGSRAFGGNGFFDKHYKVELFDQNPVFASACPFSMSRCSFFLEKLEMLGSIVLRLAHYDACVNLSTLCKRGIFSKEHAKQK